MTFIMIERDIEPSLAVITQKQLKFDFEFTRLSSTGNSLVNREHNTGAKHDI